VEYLEIAKKAMLFRPRVVIVAFYSGNDPLDSFTRAYANERWGALRSQDLPDKIGRPPKVHYPTRKQDQWPVAFADGVATVMNPSLRYACNSDHQAVRAGYHVMGEAAARIAEMGRKTKTKTVFTVIPTKELAFATRIKGEGIEQNEIYAKLIESEPAHMARLRERIQGIPDATFVDVVAPLQGAIASSNTLCYRTSSDGHPLRPGHQVIADALEPEVEKILP